MAHAQSTPAPLDLTLHAPASSLPAPPVPAASPIPNPVVPGATVPAAPPVPTLETASAEVQAVARWVSGSHDNANLPYLLIDKANATVYAFGRDGRMIGGAPILLGMGKGDKMVVANATEMGNMRPEQRITPAGRFVSRLAVDSHGKELLVLDYDASLSLHAVVKGKPAEHRAERLASPTSTDNRISYGCINVPTAFYSGTISTTFAKTRGIVYVLPEMSGAGDFFGFEPAATTSDIAVAGLPPASPTAALSAPAAAVQTPDR